MKIRPMGATVLHAHNRNDRWTNRQTW